MWGCKITCFFSNNECPKCDLPWSVELLYVEQEFGHGVAKFAPLELVGSCARELVFVALLRNERDGQISPGTLNSVA
jgi:hypothetical protein